MNTLPLFLLAISLPLLLGGCGEKHEGVNQKALELREGVNYLKYSDIPYTGKSFKLNKNGLKWQETNFKDGKEHGLYVSWHENGQKRSERNWKEGKKISEKWWNSKGKPVDTYEEAK